MAFLFHSFLKLREIESFFLACFLLFFKFCWVTSGEEMINRRFSRNFTSGMFTSNPTPLRHKCQGKTFTLDFLSLSSSPAFHFSISIMNQHRVYYDSLAESRFSHLYNAWKKHEENLLSWHKLLFLLTLVNASLKLQQWLYWLHPSSTKKQSISQPYFGKLKSLTDVSRLKTYFTWHGK